MTQIGTITNQELKKNRDGSIAVRLLQVQVSNESDIQTVQYMSAPGEDSAPINGDKVQILSIGPAFKFAVATEDQNNAAAVPAGGKRLFSRDADTGAVKAFIAFLTGGDLQLNGAAYSAVRFGELQTAFDQLKADFDAHLGHFSPTNGPPTASTADITPAESATVKML